MPHARDPPERYPNGMTRNGLILSLLFTLWGPGTGLAAPTAKTGTLRSGSRAVAAPAGLGPGGSAALESPVAAPSLRGTLPAFQTPALPASAIPDGRVDVRGLVPKSPAAAAALTARARGAEVAGRGLPVEAILARRDALLIGESHTALSPVKTVALQMERFKRAGVSVVGVEGLKTFSQEALDRYFDGGDPRLPEEALSFSPARRGEFAELLRSAKAAGVRVVALGRPLDRWGRRVAGLAAARTGKAPLSFGTDLAAQVERADRSYRKGFNESVAEVVLRERNEDMAEILARNLPEGGKAVVIAGSAHVAHPPEWEYRLFGLPVSRFGTLADALRTRLLSAFSVTMTGGLFTHPGGSADQRALLGPAVELLETAGDFVRTSAETALLRLR